MIRITFLSFSVFQLTTSRGGRPTCEGVTFFCNSFQLTTSRGGRHSTIIRRHTPEVFQLTTSRGGRPVYTNQLFKQSNISTHDLTRRSTYIDLVLMLFGIYFNSRPHEEVDLIQRLVWTLVIHFNSRPHEEVDRRYGNPYRYLDISTHDLTRRSTAYEKVRSIVSNISTHDLTRRSTQTIWVVRMSDNVFQLTTSRGGRRKISECLDLAAKFQLTTSRGGRPFYN